MTENKTVEAPPIKMMESLSQTDEYAAPAVPRSVREANHERIRKQLAGDREWYEKFSSSQLPRSLETVDTLDRLDANPMFAAGGFLDLSQGPATHVLVPPYHYDGRGAGSTARLFPNHQAGTIGLGARAGSIDGLDTDIQEGTCWVGVGLFSSQTIRVRVAPMIFWRSLWTIGVAGIAVFTSSPWSDWKASVRTQAYDASGPVSPLLSELLVHRRLRDAPGAEWLKDDSFDSGTAPTMHSFFTIPGGTTRWFNVMAHGISEVDYSFENSAFATCGMDVNINLIVVERL
jgi:hypothetical protein